MGDIGMAMASDAEILAYADRNQDVIVTLDADFHQLLAMSAADSPSVVRIRIEGLKGDKLASLLFQILTATSTELNAGAVVSVTRGRIRVRSLPIGR